MVHRVRKSTCAESALPNKRGRRGKAHNAFSWRDFCLAQRKRREQAVLSHDLVCLGVGGGCNGRQSNDGPCEEPGDLAAAATVAHRRTQVRPSPPDPRWQRAHQTQQALAESLRLFKPARVIARHRAIVRRNWTFQKQGRRGRPSLDAELERRIVRIAQENHARIRTHIP